MHYSMFSAGPHSDEEKILNLRKVYNEAFSELDVDLVLSGHDHLYARTYLMKGMKSTGNASGLKNRGKRYICPEHLLLEASFMRRRVEKRLYCLL